MVVETHKTALRLVALDAAAAAQGLQVGMTLADARARLPRLAVADADPCADLALLMRVAQACRRFTPALALHARDGLDLDVTGCAGLFGGEARLLLAVAAVVHRLGLTLRSALADTAALAYAVARFGAGGVAAPGRRAELLAPLPVEALRLEPQGCTVLRQLGFRRIGQLIELPRATLARRVGAAALHRLDEALGARDDPLELSLEPPLFRAERRLFEPVSEAEQVLQVTADLAVDLAVQLDGRAQGGRRFSLELYRVDGAVRRLGVAASRPLNHAPQIAALFAERLAGLNEGLQADFGFDQLRLVAEQAEPLRAVAGELLAETTAPGAVEALADRLAARGGAVAHRPAPVDVHRPEAADTAAGLDVAAGWAPLPATHAHGPPRLLDTPLRPLRLFRPPQPIEVAAAEIPEGPPARFTWRRIVRTVVRAEGPERLEPEWGRDPAPSPVRDYYRLEDEGGRRYWVFRQDRYDAPPEPDPASARARPVEEVKPVRPPPKPEPTLPAALAAARNPRIQDATRPRPHLQLVGAPAATAEEFPASSTVADTQGQPPAPAWFLHGLFG